MTVSGIDYLVSREIDDSQTIFVNIRLHPYFSITGELYEGGIDDEHFVCGGCIHEKISEHFPELSKFIKWHLVSPADGPIHYIANSIYWLKEGNLDHFASTAIYGVLPDDDIEHIDSLVTPDGLTTPDLNWAEAHLRQRLPDLMALFEQEMVELVALLDDL